MTRSDLAVVGAGPAGSAAAWRLARAGARVTVFDASHPREKPCGGGLTGRALAIVRQMLDGFPIDGVPILGMRFGSGPPATGRMASVPFSKTDSLVVVSRKALDQALLEAAVRAGARLIAERVTDVAVEPGAVRVTTMAGCYPADGLIGADGVASLVRRRVLGQFGRGQFSIAAGYFVAGRSAAEVAVQSFGHPPGYLWSFPRPDHLAVGICAPAGLVRTAGEVLPLVRNWLAHEGLAEGTTLRAYCWPIPSLGWDDLQRLRVSGPRWMLAGDAAGLVDPLTREGLFYALQSGLLAAESWLAEEDPSDRYAERIAGEITPELARAAALEATFFSSGFADLLVDALNRSQAVRAIMRDLVAGRQAYATLRRRLLRTFEVGLAWQLLQLQLRGMVAPPACRRAMWM